MADACGPPAKKPRAADRPPKTEVLIGTVRGTPALPQHLTCTILRLTAAALGAQDAGHWARYCQRSDKFIIIADMLQCSKDGDKERRQKIAMLTAAGCELAPTCGCCRSELLNSGFPSRDVLRSSTTPLVDRVVKYLTGLLKNVTPQTLTLVCNQHPALHDHPILELVLQRGWLGRSFWKDAMLYVSRLFDGDPNFADLGPLRRIKPGGQVLAVSNSALVRASATELLTTAGFTSDRIKVTSEQGLATLDIAQFDAHLRLANVNVSPGAITQGMAPFIAFACKGVARDSDWPADGRLAASLQAATTSLLLKDTRDGAFESAADVQRAMGSRVSTDVLTRHLAEVGITTHHRTVGTKTVLEFLRVTVIESDPAYVSRTLAELKRAALVCIADKLIHVDAHARARQAWADLKARHGPLTQKSQGHLEQNLASLKKTHELASTPPPPNPRPFYRPTTAPPRVPTMAELERRPAWASLYEQWEWPWAKWGSAFEKERAKEEQARKERVRNFAYVHGFSLGPYSQQDALLAAIERVMDRLARADAE